MSTSKENYDHLVYLDGNYGIDISRGIWPGSGQNPGIKGDKGDTGYAEKGQKGQKGLPGVNGSNGSQGPVGSKGSDGAEGPKGLKGAEGPKGDVGTKGQKGQLGAGTKGQKGEDAATPVFVFKGQVFTFNDLPLVGNSVGDVYQTTDDDNLYAWDGTKWDTIAEAIGVVKGDEGPKGQKGVDGATSAKGEKGQKGDKGIGGGQGDKGQKGEQAEKGEKGDKGATGNAGTNGTDGTDGTKGEKGQKGEDVDYNLVYTKTQTDFLIQDFKAPQYAFDIDAYPLEGTPEVNPNKIIEGTVDFNGGDQNAPVYNSGIVTINSNVTVANSPIAASDLMVVNYISINPGDLRGTDYALLQYVFANNESSGDTLGYFRFTQPAQGKFGEWHLSQFPIENYYTKTEVDEKDRSYAISAIQDGDADLNKTKLLLTDDNGSTTGVNVNATGGLTATVTNGNTITVDASSISGNVTFEGPITAEDTGVLPPIAAQDPATLDPTPNGGDYFIFTNAGTAWNGDAVTQGDWAIYNASAGQWITLDYQTSDTGVTEVTVSGGILTLGGTTAEPQVTLTKAALDAAIPEYVTNQQLGSSITGLQVADLSDVDILGNATFTPSTLAFAQYNNQVANNTQPAGNGQYSVIPEENIIWMMQNSVNNPGSLYINTMLSTATAGDKFIIKATDGSWQQVVTFVSYSQTGGTRKLKIEEASGVAAVNGYTNTWAIRGQVANFGIVNNQILRYNSTSSKWELSSAYTTSAADTEFLSKTQGGTVAKSLQVARNAGSVASNSFVLQGRVTANGSNTGQLLKTYIYPTSNVTAKDWIQYFGETDTNDNQIQTRGSVNTKLLDYMQLNASQIVTGQQTFKYPSSGGTGNRVLTIATSSGADAVVLNGPTGAIAIGREFDHGNTDTNSSPGVKYLVAKKLSNSYIDIFTTDNTGQFVNGNSYGTVRIGTPNAGDNIFQVFSPSGSGGAIQSLVVKTNGQVTAANQGSTIGSASMTDSSVVTKRQLVAELDSLGNLSSPVGTIVATLGSTPAGWFRLDGSFYSEAQYPQLAAVLQTTAGYVAGQLPDFRGQHLVMKGGNDFNTTPGTKYGSRTKMPTLPFGMLTAGEHFHKYGSNARYGGGTTKSSYDADPRTDYSFSTQSAGSHVHTITGGDSVTNPPCAVVYWIIKRDS